MTIPTPALKRLAEQVQEAVPDTTINYGDIDGIDRYRSVTFSGEAASYLAPLLPALQDERIAGWREEGGDLVVSVVGRAPADFAHDFALDQAAGVIHDIPKGQPGNPYSEQDAQAHIDGAHEPVSPDPESTKAAPAKKAAKRQP